MLLFYSLSLLFIVVEIYQLINRGKIFERKINNLDEKIPYFWFYLSKFFYLIWMELL